MPLSGGSGTVLFGFAKRARSAAIHAFQRSCHIAFSPSQHPAAV
jgi:hypothetical protein